MSTYGQSTPPDWCVVACDRTTRKISLCPKGTFDPKTKVTIDVGQLIDNYRVGMAFEYYLMPAHLRPKTTDALMASLNPAGKMEALQQAVKDGLLNIAQARAILESPNKKLEPRKGWAGLGNSPHGLVNSPAQEQKDCTCDLITQILPYGCKCGGK